MIKYRHRNCDKAFSPATFAYGLPYAYNLQDLVLNAKEKLVIPFGLTVVHPKDNYNKAFGRSAALKNFKVDQEFKVSSIEIRNERTIFHLGAQIRNRYVTLEFSVDPKSYKVRLENINLY